MVKWIVEPRGKFRERHEADSAGEHYVNEEGEHIIVLPKGASTRTKMHELAHAELGHVGFAKTYGERAERELAADAWVYEKLGRTPAFGELINDFIPGIDELIEEGYRANQIFTWLKGEFEGFGYTLDKEDRSKLWWWIRDKYELLKGSRS